MSKYRKIVWNEGMLLTPHHFQQWDNYHEDLLHSRIGSVAPFCYGILDLKVNNEAIANANFQITRCRAVMPDGLCVAKLKNRFHSLSALLESFTDSLALLMSNFWPLRSSIVRMRPPNWAMMYSKSALL